MRNLPYWLRFFIGTNDLKIRTETIAVAWVKRRPVENHELIVLMEFRLLWMKFTVWGGANRQLADAITEELSEPREVRLAKGS